MSASKRCPAGSRRAVKNCITVKTKNSKKKSRNARKTRKSRK